MPAHATHGALYMVHTCFSSGKAEAEKEGNSHSLSLSLKAERRSGMGHIDSANGRAQKGAEGGGLGLTKKAAFIQWLRRHFFSRQGSSGSSSNTSGEDQKSGPSTSWRDNGVGRGGVDAGGRAVGGSKGEAPDLVRPYSPTLTSLPPASLPPTTRRMAPLTCS